MDTVNEGWYDIRPESDSESFTERSDERRQLFKHIKEKWSVTNLGPVTWAFFQVAALEKVREWCESENLWTQATTTSALAHEPKYRDVLRLWTQDNRKSTATDATSASSIRKTKRPARTSLSSSVTSDILSHTRSGNVPVEKEGSVNQARRVAELCKERDGGRCAVSRWMWVDAAHIYPWPAFGHDKAERVKLFWDVLRVFWPVREVEEWQKVLFVDTNHPNQATESVANMISLTATLHRAHTSGAFALRPIQMSADKKQLELEFHWLQMEKRAPGSTVDLMVEPSSSRNDPSPQEGYGPFRRMDPSSSTDLHSGTRFTMSTDDPDKKPLPDPGLLTMQWHLQRVLAMSGAAGWKEEEFGDDDDDDDDDDNAPGQAVEPNIEAWIPDPQAHHQSHNSPWDDDGDSGNGLFE